MKTEKPQIGVMGQLSTQNVLEDLDFVIKNGFDWFEIALDWKQNFNLSDKTLREIRQRAEKNKVKLIVHTSWYLPVATIVPELKKAVIKNIEKGITIAGKLGAERVTVHPGYREMPGPAMHLNYESLVDTLKTLVEFANKNKTNICFENFDNAAALLCNQLEDYLKVLNLVPGLKTTLDIGHAHTSKAGEIEYLRAVKNTIMDMHVHDNSGEKDEHKCLGEGSIDFVGLFRECKKIGYYGPFILELFPYENILKGRNKFLENWEKAK